MEPKDFFSDDELWFNQMEFDDYTKSIDTPQLKMYKKHKDGIITCRIEAIFDGFDPYKAF